MPDKTEGLLPSFGQQPSRLTPPSPLEIASKPFGLISFSQLTSLEQLEAVGAQIEAISQMPPDQAFQRYLNHLNSLRERINRAINESD